MYLQRPRLRYNGCYINKTSYIRDGENNFQDRFYRPWHLVEYFRYLRYITTSWYNIISSICMKHPISICNYITKLTKKSKAKMYNL